MAAVIKLWKKVLITTFVKFYAIFSSFYKLFLIDARDICKY